MTNGVVTITLGTAAGSLRNNNAFALIWTPSTSVFDRAGNLNTSATATESGPSDSNF